MFEKDPNLPNQFNETKAPPPVDLPMASEESQEPAAAKPAEDIFADVDKTQPVSEKPARPPEIKLPPPPAEQLTEEEPPSPRRSKLVIIIIIALIGAGVLATAGWFVFKMVYGQLKSEKKPSPSPVNSVNKPPANVNFLINQPLINQPLNRPTVLDSDHDGLTDEEEKLYGTDSLKVDTDGDGLTDRDEAKVFKTDPTNSDTDGDGYLDGQEIRAGYDPKGPGKLFEVR